MARAILQLDEQSIELPIVSGTNGPDGLDIGRLFSDAGLFAVDSGLANTAEGFSGISYIDGNKGELSYRGYPVADLASRGTFLEVCFLLLYGELPTRHQLTDFEKSIGSFSKPPESAKKIVQAFDAGAHPMHILASVIPALGSEAILDPADQGEATIDAYSRYMLGVFPTIVAWIHRHTTKQDFQKPVDGADYPANFLQMVFTSEQGENGPDSVSSAALDGLLILHADHGQNCSTTAARLVGSSGADIFSSIGAAVQALSGPKHGGANQDVLQLLERVRNEFESVPAFLNASKTETGAIRLPGFGHRVYKTVDPRAAYIKGVASRVLEELDRPDPLLDIAMELEELALTDPYFIERRLYPNVDFYSGIIYRALGFPSKLFTALFALGRLPGWLAHWREGTLAGSGRIYRPGQIYTGPPPREFQSIDSR
jgi:citrate synthase